MRHRIYEKVNISVIKLRRCIGADITWTHILGEMSRFKMLNLGFKHYLPNKDQLHIYLDHLFNINYAVTYKVN